MNRDRHEGGPAPKGPLHGWENDKNWFLSGLNIGKRKKDLFIGGDVV